MSSLLISTIETLQNDIRTLLELKEDKHYNKHRALIIKRLESLEKLVQGDAKLGERLVALRESLG